MPTGLIEVMDAHGVRHVGAGLRIDRLCEMTVREARRTVAWFAMTAFSPTCLWCCARLVPGLSPGFSWTMNFGGVQP